MTRPRQQSAGGRRRFGGRALFLSIAVVVALLGPAGSAHAKQPRDERRWVANTALRQVHYDIWQRRDDVVAELLLHPNASPHDRARIVELLFDHAFPRDKKDQNKLVKQVLAIVDEAEHRYHPLLAETAEPGKSPLLRRAVGADRHPGEQFERAKVIAAGVIRHLEPLGLPHDPIADEREAAGLRQRSAESGVIVALAGQVRRELRKLAARQEGVDTPATEVLARRQDTLRRLVTQIQDEQERLIFERSLLETALGENVASPLALEIIEEAMRLVGVEPPSELMDPAATARVLAEISAHLEVTYAFMDLRSVFEDDERDGELAAALDDLANTLTPVFEGLLAKAGGTNPAEEQALDLLQRARDDRDAAAVEQFEPESSALAEVLSHNRELFEEAREAITHPDPDGPPEKPVEQAQRIIAEWDVQQQEPKTPDDTTPDRPEEGSAKSTTVGREGSEVLGNPPHTPLPAPEGSCRPHADPFTTFSTSCLPRIGGIGLTNPGADNRPELLANPGAPRLEPDVGCALFSSSRTRALVDGTDVRGGTAAVSRMDLCQLRPGMERSTDRVRATVPDAAPPRGVLGANRWSAAEFLPQLWPTPAAPSAVGLNLSTSGPPTTALPSMPVREFGGATDSPGPGPEQSPPDDHDADQEQRAADISNREARQAADRDAREHVQRDQIAKDNAAQQFLVDTTMAAHEAAVVEGQRYTKERDRTEAERVATEAAAKAEWQPAGAEEQPDGAPHTPAPVSATSPAPPPYRAPEVGGADGTGDDADVEPSADDESDGGTDSGDNGSEPDERTGGQLVSCADWQDGMEGACDANSPSTNSRADQPPAVATPEEIV